MPIDFSKAHEEMEAGYPHLEIDSVQDAIHGIVINWVCPYIGFGQFCQLWMEEEVATGKDGEKITGGQMMVRVAVKEVAKGNPRFWELLRDTAGFKPVDKVMVAEVDPAVIDEVEKLVEEAGK